MIIGHYKLATQSDEVLNQMLRDIENIYKLKDLAPIEGSII